MIRLASARPRDLPYRPYSRGVRGPEGTVLVVSARVPGRSVRGLRRGAADQCMGLGEVGTGFTGRKSSVSRTHGRPLDTHGSHRCTRGWSPQLPRHPSSQGPLIAVLPQTPTSDPWTSHVKTLPRNAKLEGVRVNKGGSHLPPHPSSPFSVASGSRTAPDSK